MTTKRGETAAIVPSDTQPIRKEPMTMDEPFWVHEQISLTECWVSPNKLQPLKEQTR